MHNNCFLATGNKVYYQQGCIGPITIHVCYLLYWVNFLGTVRGLSLFFSNNTVQQHNIDIQQHYTVHDYNKPKTQEMKSEQEQTLTI